MSMVSTLSFSHAGTRRIGNTTVRAVAAGADPELTLKGPAGERLKAIFGQSFFRPVPDGLAVGLDTAVLLLAPSLTVAEGVRGQAFLLSYPRPGHMLVAFERLIEKGIDQEPAKLADWLQRVSAFCAKNPDAVTPWTRVQDVVFAEPPPALGAADAPPDSIRALCDTTWGAVTDEGACLGNLLGLRHRLGPAYRLEERKNNSFEDRLAAIWDHLPSSLRDGSMSSKGKAEQAWGEALAVVPPLCLRELEGLAGHSRFLALMLGFDSLPADRQVAIWVERRDVFLGDFGELKAAIEASGSDAEIKEALVHAAGILLGNPNNFPSLIAFKGVAK